jgi:hypothetical protein
MKTEKIKWILNYCKTSNCGVDVCNHIFVDEYADKWKQRNRRRTEPEISRYLYGMFKLGILTRTKIMCGGKRIGCDQVWFYNYNIKEASNCD